jgi:hypothetical protein
MLKFNHKAMWGTNISDVLFAGLLIVLDKLLAFGREVVFPSAVPVGFLFSPGITIPHSPVRPVEDSVRATFGNNLAVATATLRPPAGVGFNTLIACKCKSHLQRLHLGSQEIGSAYLHRARRQHDSVNATSSIVTVAIVMMVMMIIPANRGDRDRAASRDDDNGGDDDGDDAANRYGDDDHGGHLCRIASHVGCVYRKPYPGLLNDRIG